MLNTSANEPYNDVTVLRDNGVDSKGKSLGKHLQITTIYPEDEASLTERSSQAFAPVIEFDDRAPLMERCADILKDRLIEKRGSGFFLDGIPANIAKIVKAAGLQFADEEAPIKSAPPRKRTSRDWRAARRDKEEAARLLARSKEAPVDLAA